MKYLKIIVLFLILSACSADGDTVTSGDGQGGSTAIFVLKGNYLYSVDHQNLNIFSLIESNKPSKVNTISVGFDIETLFSYGDNLYIGSRSGMFIYSISNPESPTQLSAVQHFTACDPVVANATHSFVTLHSTSICGTTINSLEIYNTENPDNPVLVHRRNLVSPKGLGLYQNYLIVCDDKLKIFDITDPANPLLVKSINKSYFDIIIQGDELYAIGENALDRYTLNASDISNVAFRSSIAF